MGKILTDSLRQPVFVIQLYIIENIEREMFDQSVYLVNPFTAKDAIWRPQVITRTAICLTFANKYFYVSQHSMRLFFGTPMGSRLLG